MGDDNIKQLQKKIFDLERLSESAERGQARDEAILRGIGNGLIITGQMGRVSLINTAASAMLGWDPQEVAGKDLAEILPMEVMETGRESAFASQQSVFSALSTGRKETSYYLKRRDGTKFPAELTTSSIIFNNQVIGAAIVFNDISAQKQAEQAKSDFIAITSHQLRTPLGVMKWNLEMLLTGDYGEITDEAKKAVGDILASNVNLVNLVNNLLDVSRIDQGMVSNMPELTNLVKVTQKVVKELEIMAVNKGVTLSFDNGTSDPSINLDPRRFEDVVENLISNAIKYTPRGGKVQVTVEQKDDKAEIRVSDSGMGIPEEDKGRMFDRFFRAKNAVKSEAEGSGLGLYVVKSYVEAWGGKVWYTSKVGEGTTFFVLIPLK